MVVRSVLHVSDNDAGKRKDGCEAAEDDGQCQFFLVGVGRHSRSWVRMSCERVGRLRVIVHNLIPGPLSGAAN